MDQPRAHREPAVLPGWPLRPAELYVEAGPPPRAVPRTIHPLHGSALLRR